MRNKISVICSGWPGRKRQFTVFSKNGKSHIYSRDNTKKYTVWAKSTDNKLLDFLAENQIVIHFFDYRLKYSGSFCKRSLFSGRLLIQQVQKHSKCVYQ